MDEEILQPVTVDNIVPPIEKPPKEPDLETKEEGKALDAAARERLPAVEPRKVNYLGRFFGTGAEKPGNIAGLTIFVVLGIIIGVLWFRPDHSIVTTLVGIVTLALGYVFGRGSDKD